MIVRQLARDLGAMSVAAAAVIVLVAIAGPLAALAVLIVVVPVGVGLALIVAGVVRALDQTDDYCSRVDRELDDERRARAGLRVVQTVQAEPQASVVDIFSREPVA